MMMNQEQLDYVKSELAAGTSAQQIEQALLGAGYTSDQVQELLNATRPANAQTSIPTAPKRGMPTWVKIVIGLVILVFVLGAVVVTTVLAQLSDARDAGNDAADISSLSNMRSQAEIYYSTNSFSYKNFCASNEAKSLLGRLNRSDCLAEEDAYRVSAELLSGEYYCVDSMGRAERLTEAPVGLGCV